MRERDQLAFSSFGRVWSRLGQNRLARNVGWNTLGSLSVTVLGPVFSIIAARLLAPADYGVFGIAMAVLAFLQVSRDLGLTQAVIVSERSDDFRNFQFTVQLAWSAVLFLVMLGLTPLLSYFYHSPDLAIVLPLLGVSLFLNSLIDPLLTANLKTQNYRFLSIRQILPTLVKGGVMVALAAMGAGVYALVAAVLVGALTDAVFLLWWSAWKPRLHFDWRQLREFMRLGKHLMFQEFCGFLVLKADALIVGKNLGMATLGFYQMGNNLANLLPNAVIPQVAQVVFTDLSRREGGGATVARHYYHFVYLVGTAALCFSIGLYWLAPYLVPLLLGQKWLDSVVVLQAFSLTIPFGPLVLLNIQISKIYGFNQAFSYLAAGRALLTIGLILAASFHSIGMVLVAWVASAMIGPTVNSLIFFRSQKFVNVTTKFVWLYGITCVWAILGLVGVSY